MESVIVPFVINIPSSKERAPFEENIISLL